MIDLYDAILRETAELGLLVDFHGSNKPTGLSRTWPNEMTREAVKGMEASNLADRATHETTLPFTRLLAGPAEYTVVHFGERRKNTTVAHQLASAVILGGAPMLTYAANPEKLLASPAADIIRNIPSAYDETIVLPGSEIGELARLLRRTESGKRLVYRGDEWRDAEKAADTAEFSWFGCYVAGVDCDGQAGGHGGCSYEQGEASPGRIRWTRILRPAAGYIARLYTSPAGAVYNIRDFGAKGDGKTNDGEAINKAVDAAAAAGGGQVYFPAGSYPSYTIHLKSNISLYIDQGRLSL